ncbi:MULTISPECIES: dimethylsulfonioproprionate lyase family protein [Roseobacteraceae]|uniref:Dimethlysulfonioproprionate lyase n=1 Tax=Pseudosulfitobacter pseudonitzschiae TaxID=1402135 RepID=A0A221K5S7_9RHOB|nr:MULTISPECIES: dimethylsulfonioproprionate lyase family protein [Roseobacteraceae]ASM74349.1 dimethlysulfonioproprionate lyase [Pseudosulfitobacter pseudonitzschiae]
MTSRSTELVSFLRTLNEFLVPRVSGNAQKLVGRIDRKLAFPGQTKGPARISPPLVCTHLFPALTDAANSDSQLSPLVNELRTLEPSLVWRPRTAGAGASANFLNDHANAMIIGPGGIEERSDVWIGLSLLAPGTRYPDHNHAPSEVYLVLSPGEFKQAGGAWFSPGVGKTFYNSPGILHAMRSTPDEPLLALWLLDVEREE